MGSTASEIKSLYEKAKAYTRTSIELYKLNAIDTTADVASSIVVRAILILLIAVFTLFVNIGLALWIGKLMGETFLGFFTVSLLYLVLAIFFYVFRESFVKTPISDFIIERLSNQKKATDKEIEEELNEITVSYEE